jgi:hypothetical protein
MKTDLILQENKAVADSVINAANESYNKGLKLLKLLSGLGLDVKEIKDWQAIENHFKASYPEASLLFNLQFKNIDAPYMEAYNYYQANKGNVSFEKLTDDAAENIRKKYRVYASETQSQALALVQETVANLNRMRDEFKIPVSSMQSISFCPVIASNADGLEVYDSNLLPYLLRLE